MTSSMMSPSPLPQNSTPYLLLNPPSIASASASRRVPPPCWSPDETVTLLNAYRDKWYSLRRGNLRAHHWQDIADQIASKFPSSPKTSVQCRHKMEKLRKRYRAEKQRAIAFRGSRFKSTWLHFKLMDDMERGPEAKEEEEEEEEDENEGNHVTPIYRNNINSNNNNNNNRFAINENRNVVQSLAMSDSSNGYRIRLPARSVPVVVPEGRLYGNYDEFGVPIPQIRATFGGANKVLRNENVMRGGMGRKVGVEEETRRINPMGEMAEAIRALGEGFVRTERMKMDMAQEIEEMRMEMEMKRTEMIIESQQQIVDAFARTMFSSVSKKQKGNEGADC